MRSLTISKLLQNESVNRETFAKHRRSTRSVPIAHCRRCRISEEVIFWTPGRQKGATLRLSCPACGDQVIDYRIDRGEVRYPRARFRLPRLSLNRALLLLVGAALLGSFGVSGWQSAPDDRRGPRAAGEPPGAGAGITGAPSPWPWPVVFGSGGPSPAAPTVFLAKGDHRSRLPEDAPFTEVRYEESRDITIVTLPPSAARWADTLRDAGFQRMY